MPTPLEIKLERGKISVLKAAGKVDGTTAPQLLQQAEILLAEGYVDMVLDLHGVSYMSSAGIVALQSISAKVRKQNGRLAIAGLVADVNRVLEITGPTNWLNLYPDLEKARASFN